MPSLSHLAHAEPNQVQHGTYNNKHSCPCIVSQSKDSAFQISSSEFLLQDGQL
jgi:hypothetical protein